MNYYFRKRLISFILLGIMLVSSIILVGCKDNSKDNGDKTLSGTITIAGSTSVQPFSEVLADKFMERYPSVRVNVQGGGSSQGVSAVLSGAADIGAVSRKLKDEEKEKKLIETVLAYDGIAIIVHPSNPVSNLTGEDVKNIYLGNIINWKELGGKNEAITVVSREAGSGTREAFAEIVMNKADISNKVIIQNSNGAVRTMVESDENAIGYISLGILNDKVKSVDIDGITPSIENIKNGNYKIARPFLYVTKKEPEGLAKTYLEFALSNEGQTIVVEEGAISSK